MIKGWLIKRKKQKLKNPLWIIKCSLGYTVTTFCFCHPSLSGREASGGRVWRPPGLSVLPVCQRPLLWLVCPWRTVSRRPCVFERQTVCAVSVPLTLLRYFRCGQRWECQRGSLQGHWLWSFNLTQQCLSVQHLSLYNISLGEKTDVMREGHAHQSSSFVLFPFSFFLKIPFVFLPSFHRSQCQ